MGFPDDASCKEPACQRRRHKTQIRFLGWEDPLEEGMSTLSSIFCLENPMDRGTWLATVHGVVKSQTRLK